MYPDRSQVALSSGTTDRSSHINKVCAASLLFTPSASSDSPQSTSKPTLKMRAYTRLAKDAGRTGCIWPLTLLLGTVVARPRLCMDAGVGAQEDFAWVITRVYNHAGRRARLLGGQPAAASFLSTL